jgi:molecular chaperone GrpE
MNTENRKTAAKDSTDKSTGAPQDDAAAEHNGPENDNPESSGPGSSDPEGSSPGSSGPEGSGPEKSPGDDSASGWTAPAGEAARAAASETVMPVEIPVESDADAILRLEAEKADLTDRLLRVAAEMDNLRKRTVREVADARKFSVAGFAGDMLAVSDNLKRALDAVPPEARDSGDEALDALLAGVDMTGREMERMLEKNGVTHIAALGERFDPHCHQAMFEVPDESVPNRTVVEVVQDGYRIGERILRAAMVGIAKGGPKAAQPEPADDDLETDPPDPPEPPDPPDPPDPSEPPEAA